MEDATYDIMLSATYIIGRCEASGKPVILA